MPIRGHLKSGATLMVSGSVSSIRQLVGICFAFGGSSGMMGGFIEDENEKYFGRDFSCTHWCEFLVGMSIFGRWRLCGPQEVSLEAIVTPSTVIVKLGEAVKFAIHGFIEFRSLRRCFRTLMRRCSGGAGRSAREKNGTLHAKLLREGIESRVISMADERPLQTLVTHTSSELGEAIAKVKEPVPAGYAEEFAAVQEKWKALAETAGALRR